MVLILVFIGFLIGSAAAILALLGGAGLALSLAAYSLFGALAVVGAALVVAIGAPRRDPGPESAPLFTPR